ncbi:MAG: hypothetical protein J1F36_04715 [Clostridiales bacterium]|nr:hypothetical protein [Clostridiales bacterium]
MDKFNGIKKANVKVRRNSYTHDRPKILWRYVVAALIVLAVVLMPTYLGFDISEYFKQDYIEQYAQD